MRRILKALNEIAGIRGSMVMSRDGMVVASCLCRPLDEEKVAAMASSVLLRTLRALSANGIEGFRRLTLTSSHGKMVFVETGIAYLVVVMDRKIELGPTNIEIDSAAMRIRSLGEMKIA